MYLLTFQGPSSKNPLAYKWYNAEEEILGKKMKVGDNLHIRNLSNYIMLVLSTSYWFPTEFL